MKSDLKIIYRKPHLIYTIVLLVACIFFISSKTRIRRQAPTIAPQTAKQGLTNKDQLAARTVLITGANRGLGLEMARQFSADGYDVIGTARRPDRAIDLKGLGVRVEQLDVTDPASVAALAKSLEGKKIDILINNAGYFGPIPLNQKQKKIDSVDIEGVIRCFQVNTIGPMRVVQALLPNLYASNGRKIINISTRQSILKHSYQSNRVHAEAYGYKQSKTALNMFTRICAGDLKPDGFIVVSLAPGWVKTDMGTHLAELTPEQSIRDVKHVIEKLTPDQTGGFWFHDGTARSW